MKKLLFYFLISSSLLISCGNEKKSPAKFTYDRTQAKTKVISKEIQTSQIDLNNKGIGPIKNVVFSDEIDESLAENGKNIFNLKCTACHNAGRRLIGPQMKGIYDRRSPEWVMNIILNPDQMIKEDPIAIALLKEYNNIMMLNQNLSEEETRALAEYFRTL